MDSQGIESSLLVAVSHPPSSQYVLIVACLIKSINIEGHSTSSARPFSMSAAWWKVVNVISIPTLKRAYYFICSRLHRSRPWSLCVYCSCPLNEHRQSSSTKRYIGHERNQSQTQIIGWLVVTVIITMQYFIGTSVSAYVYSSLANLIFLTLYLSI